MKVYVGARSEQRFVVVVPEHADEVVHAWEVGGAPHLFMYPEGDEELAVYTDDEPDVDLSDEPRDEQEAAWERRSLGLDR